MEYGSKKACRRIPLAAVLSHPIQDELTASSWVPPLVTGRPSEGVEAPRVGAPTGGPARRNMGAWAAITGLDG